MSSEASRCEGAPNVADILFGRAARLLVGVLSDAPPAVSPSEPRDTKATRVDGAGLGTHALDVVDVEHANEIPAGFDQRPIVDRRIRERDRRELRERAESVAA